MVITEAGYGAHEELGEDGKIHDQARIDYLREYVYNVGLANSGWGRGIRIQSMVLYRSSQHWKRHGKALWPGLCKQDRR